MLDLRDTRQWPMGLRRAYYSLFDLVYVRSHFRSRPGMAWTGVRDVFVREHLRRPPYWYESNAA